MQSNTHVHTHTRISSLSPSCRLKLQQLMKMEAASSALLINIKTVCVCVCVCVPVCACVGGCVCVCSHLSKLDTSLRIKMFFHLCLPASLLLHSSYPFSKQRWQICSVADTLFVGYLCVKDFLFIYIFYWTQSPVASCSFPVFLLRMG